MITPAQRAEIRRLSFGEHWKIGTIAAALGVHHETVRAALQHETGGLRRGVSRPSALDPFLPFIRDTLTQYPRLRATRLHEMLRLRGYPGSAVQVRRLVRRLRPQATTHVYRRVVTLAGEQAQVDWGTFGTVRIGHGTRAVSGFVMVLGYSRALFALFTLDQTLESFLRGHVAAFQALGGSARTLIYDNRRSAVLDRRGTAIQFHPRLLELAGHYHFAPRPCTPARGNEKGKVERQIQYLRHAFFAARPFRDLDDLNAQFRRWRDDIAHQRRHPEQQDRTVADVLKRFSDSPCTAWARRGTSACTNAGGPMQAYSMDLRERALLDSDAGMKAADVAVKYRVSGSWVRLLKQRRRETGEVAPRVQRHGRRRMLEPHLHTLAALIAEQPDRTLAELKDALGTPASLATIWRAVAALDVTVKKNGPARRTRST